MKNVWNKLLRYASLVLLVGLLSGCRYTMVGRDAITQCITCELFGKVFNAINTFAGSAMERMSSIALPLLGVGYALWLLVTLARGMLGGQRLDKDFFMTQFLMGAKVAAAAVILSNVSYIYEIFSWIINPILHIFFDFAVHILEGGAKMSELMDLSLISQLQSHIQTTYGGKAGLLDPALARNVEVILFYIQQFLSVLTAWGQQMFMEILVALHVGLVGFIMLLLCYALTFSFVFALLDPFIRLAVFVVLFPLWLVGLCFGPTKKMSLAAMKAIVVAGGQLFLTSIYFAVFFIVMLGYAKLSEIPRSDPIPLNYMISILVNAITMFIFFCLFFVMYYFIKGMNKSIGYVLNDTINDPYGSIFMLCAGKIASWIRLANGRLSELGKRR